MSDTMLNAVIRMPYEMAMGSEISRLQFYNRAQSLLIERAADKARIAELVVALEGMCEASHWDSTKSIDAARKTAEEALAQQGAASTNDPINRPTPLFNGLSGIKVMRCEVLPGDVMMVGNDLFTLFSSIPKQGKEGGV